MTNIMYQQIEDLFTNSMKTMVRGLWFSGVEGEGEYKKWWGNGKLCIHCFYKEDRLNGEYKAWHPNGQLEVDVFYKQGLRDGEYKQ